MRNATTYMSAKLEFVDTNILLYAVDHSVEKKQRRAAELLTRLWLDGNGCISVQVLQEFFVNATRKIASPLDASVARQVVADYGQWIVHAPTSASVIAAIDIQQAYQLSFWDAMVVNSAISLQAGTLWTEDLNENQTYGGLQVRSPFSGS